MRPRPPSRGSRSFAPFWLGLLKEVVDRADPTYMRRKRAGRGTDGSAPSEEWYGKSWLCECDYSNVGSDRCYYCGGLAPSELRAQVSAAQRTESLA